MPPSDPQRESSAEKDAESLRMSQLDTDVDPGSRWREDMSRTGFAPSFAPPMRPDSPANLAPIKVLAKGTRLGDFEIEDVLGRGAFGIVYLARQLSLERQVALKITRNLGHEGRTMARLEHENIVQVFSESVSPDGKQRWLCMQYIPGTTLEAVIRSMHGQKSREWSGESILALIDELHPDPPAFHPGALRERQELGHADSLEAVCWIGARLAEALAYAHQNGVLHRDIKPANILKTRYGRPMLTDFNLAFQPINIAAGNKSLFGGTLAYMSPEHLDAFHPNKETSPDVVDERSDIFSLGVVLHELATGDVALPSSTKSLDNLEKLEWITDARRSMPLTAGKSSTTSGQVFNRVIHECLAPDPEHRCQRAADLAESLAGCKSLSEAEKELPHAGLVTRSAFRHPFVWLILLAILPHLPIGSTVNIAYNAFRIVGHLSPTQQNVFQELVVAYNGILYPLCLGWLAYVLRPVFVVWKASRNDEAALDAEQIDAARQRTTRWPFWAVTLAGIGWLPGGIFFPLALHVRAGPVEPWVFVHFLVSCTLSGLIAMTYSYFAIQFLATRIFYPNLWGNVANLHATATAELGGLRRYLSIFQMLAGLVPLAGAILVVALGPEDESTFGVFQFLVITLIVLGFFGFELANRSSFLINQTVHAMTKRRGTRRDSRSAN